MKINIIHVVALGELNSWINLEWFHLNNIPLRAVTKWNMPYFLDHMKLWTWNNEIIFNAFMTRIFFRPGPIHGFAQTKKATIVTWRNSTFNWSSILIEVGRWRQHMFNRSHILHTDASRREHSIPSQFSNMLFFQIVCIWVIASECLNWTTYQKYVVYIYADRNLPTHFKANEMNAPNFKICLHCSILRKLNVDLIHVLDAYIDWAFGNTVSMLKFVSEMETNRCCIYFIFSKSCFFQTYNQIYKW